MNAVIIDFSRTLKDPDLGEYIPGSFELLNFFREKKILMYLVSAGNFFTEEDRLKLSKFFEEIVIVEEKSEIDFRKILENNGFNKNDVMVLGDRINGEIEIGNRLGLKTIRFKKGKFANLDIENDYQKADFVVTDLMEAKEIISNEIGF